MRGADRRKVKIKRRLRRDSTGAEMVLWLSIRDRRLSGFKFVRQENVDKFIVDFVCREKKLILKSMAGSTLKVGKIKRATKRLNALVIAR